MFEARDFDIYERAELLAQALFKVGGGKIILSSRESFNRSVAWIVEDNLDGGVSIWVEENSQIKMPITDGQLDLQIDCIHSYIITCSKCRGIVNV